MTTPRFDAVGYCAHYSQQGDWAFEFSLELARRNSIRLNLFHFLSDPYDPHDQCGRSMTRAERSELVIEREKELRFYYEPKLGDFLDAGFRLCEDHEWTELHQCLTRREFQVLVLPYVAPGSSFGGKPIEQFAGCFVCPVVLVGPDSRSEYRLNQPAALLAERFGLTCPAMSDSNIQVAQDLAPASAAAMFT